ncbi:DoxX family protein [Corynebacterium glucuronolyticum]
MDRPFIRETALLLLRLVLGVIFIAHGWDKMFITGPIETAGQFSAMGVPNARFSAYAAGIAELAGGGMLILGFLSTIVAGVLILLMGAAIFFAHWGSGFFVGQGGPEFVMVLIAALIMIVVFGAGRVSLDRVFADD